MEIEILCDALFCVSLVSLLNKVVEVFSVLCNQIDYLQPYARDLAVQICFRNYPKKPLRFALDFPVLHRFVSETIKTEFRASSQK